MSLGTNPLLFPAGSVSISAWMKFSGLYGFLFSNWWGGPEWRGLNVGVWGDGENGPNATAFAIFLGQAAAETDQLEGPAKYNDDQWHHVVAVYDQQNLQLRLYIDGALIANKTTTVDMIQYGANTASEARLGASALSNGSQYHFAGTIDELKLYGRALDDQDAAALFANYGYVTVNLPGRELVRRIAGIEPVASVGGEEVLNTSEQTALFVQSGTGNVGIGTDVPGERLSVAGLIESTTGGIKFPDGTIQTTAGGPGGGGDSLPLGTIMAWHKDLTGTPPLPVGWVECNGQIINETASPYNGQTLPDLNHPKESWNTKGSFLRGGAMSGEFEDDQFQGHTAQSNTVPIAQIPIANTGSTFKFPPEVYARDASSWSLGTDIISGNLTTEGNNGSPRTGSETSPVNMTVVWIIKITDTAGTGGSGGGHWSNSGDTIFYHAGLVGVGTSSPNEALTIDGAISLKEQPRLAEGSANHGKLYVRQGGPVSLSFDGVDDYVDLSAHIAAFQGLTTGTISMWFRSRNTTIASGSLFRYGSATNNGDTLELGLGPWATHITDETMQFNISANGSPQIAGYLRRGEQFLADQA
ncbi:MAG: LamG domain-containing protein, partial [Leptospirales bacterium]